MTTTAEPAFVPGVWGPYYSAMVPGVWLNEGGQSAAGAAIDQLLEFHPHAAEAHGEAARDGQSLPSWHADRAEKLLAGRRNAAELARGLHVVPEFLGNRAPHADPHTRAVIAGLGISGGAGRSALIRQLLADATGVRLAAPASEEPVLLGSAILGAVAAGVYGDIPSAMEAMSSFADIYEPQGGQVQELHDTRFAIFERFQSVARQAARH